MFDISFVDKYKDLIKKAEDYIWNNPETGFKEIKTNEYLINEFEKLGYRIERAKDLTGFYTTIDTGREGPTVLIMAELDGLIIPDHPCCDKNTGAVHACGHNMQCSALLGIGAVIKENSFLDELSGKIKLCFVPAEEGIEFGYRQKLKEEGKIEFFTGKLEFIKRGYFDDVDLSFMVHAGSISKEGIKFRVDTGHNGLIQKNITFIGKSAHAGSNPFDGINALNMANNALSVINNMRETFKEEDHVRFHYIITHGGDSSNIIPNKVTVECCIRASSNEAIDKYNKLIDRACAGVAYAYGGSVKVVDVPGYATLKDDENLVKVGCEVLEKLVGKDGYFCSKWLSSSTDLGEISAIMPTFIVYTNCAEGNFHGNDLYIKDENMAGVENVKFQILVLRELLKNNAEKAKEIVKNFKRKYKSTKEFVDERRKLFRDEYLSIK